MNFQHQINAQQISVNIFEKSELEEKSDTSGGKKFEKIQGLKNGTEGYNRPVSSL